jgi:predicted LPLAT superfamily acyltransferase
VPFLGAPAPFSQGPYILAALLRCPVLLLFCTRAGDGYRVALEPFAPRIELPARRKQPALEEWTRAYAARLQEHCLGDPLQWYNFFDFWAADEPAHPPRRRVAAGLGGGLRRAAAAAAQRDDRPGPGHDPAAPG